MDVGHLAAVIVEEGDSGGPGPGGGRSSSAAVPGPLFHLLVA